MGLEGKLCQRRFRWAVRKNLFMKRVVRQWVLRKVIRVPIYWDPEETCGCGTKGLTLDLIGQVDGWIFDDLESRFQPK